MTKPKILFVCLGNICRSPLAEGVLLHLNEQQQLGWTIDSAGTANYHVGEAPDKRTIRNAAANGVDLKALRARQFEADDFDKFDLILVMDANNKSNVLRLSKQPQHQKKVHLFLEYAGIQSPAEVPDPYYGEEKDFDEVFQLVKNACDVLLKKLAS